MIIKDLETNRGGQVFAHRQKDGSVKTNVFGNWEYITSGQELDLLLEMCRLDKKREDYSEILSKLLSLRDNNNVGIAKSPLNEDFEAQVVNCSVQPQNPQILKLNCSKVERKPKVVYPKVNYSKEQIEEMEQLTQKYMDFCKDCEFEPSIRNVNTFVYKCKEGLSQAKEYFVQRLRICGGEWEIADSKVKSDEFKELVERFSLIEMSGNKVNTRLKIYEGIPGGGKTTQAMKEANGNCIICNSSMLPSDLIEDFKLVDGKGNLIPSPLRQAMENGEKILLDEIHTLTLDCLRFLQGLCDNKESFIYKDEEIIINEGFEIIGTMNLMVNGVSFPLTEALCDRCSSIEEFKLTNKKLVKLAFC